ncbi:type 1 glutamine amidotransferase [Sulfitobacter sp. D35]|uniref:type 1 glutamine amidotransferase n=1 Tax=Sulfitobacter sp. D35 TaxID=3083252 RepID=UPI00296ED73E|nr:type 1 glutamine amidotransferase [Sulfitobacter sp. D35]MDW4499686.1 type 1 glutamine amidotransferase [Sulfitobacter sp. D35]
MPLNVAILDLTMSYTGTRPGEEAGEMIRRWLTPAMPEATFARIHIAGGAALPPLDSFDACVLSGSEIGVYDDRDWLPPLRDFLLRARDARRPLAGICFGHQIMADVFGGKAENVHQGVRLGVQKFQLDGLEHNAWVWHQDQVTAIPPGAQVSGEAAYCPVGALDYEFPAYSVQFHPEFTRDFFDHEIRQASGKSIDPALAELALQQVATEEVAPDLVADRFAEVLRRA